MEMSKKMKNEDKDRDFWMLDFVSVRGLRIWDFEPVSLFIIYEHLPLRAAQVHTGFQTEKKRKRQLSPKLFHCHRTELNFS